MHQHPRQVARVGSAASPSRTNPMRTNHERNDPSQDRARLPLSDRSPQPQRQASEYDDSEDEQGLYDKGEAQMKNAVRLTQIVTQFFYKAALVILSSRMPLPPLLNRHQEPKLNKWFNLTMNDSEDVHHLLAEWRLTQVRPHAPETRPPPMLLEVYIDLKDLADHQSLVVIDDHGKRHNVADALRDPPRPDLIVDDYRQFSSSDPIGAETHELVLERWTLHVADEGAVPCEEDLPTVYKKAIILFRALVTYSKLLPAYRFCRRMSRQGGGQGPFGLRYRVQALPQAVRDDPGPSNTLFRPLYPADYNIDPVADEYRFEPTQTPLGPLMLSVTYRLNCDFRIDESEAVLSSQFMGLDEDEFYPTLAPASLPAYRSGDNAPNMADHSQAYGSMSTFHQVGPATGSSPISALRAARDVNNDSPTASPPQKIPPNHRTAQGSKSSLRSGDAMPITPRRTSVSFQPFKAGSLASSPASGPYIPPSPGTSLGKTSNLNPLTQARNRSSLTTLPQTVLRAPSIPNETAIVSSASSSPKPAPISRYSSSFGQRRSRFSSGGGSKTEDDNTSSGKGSLASSTQPGSGTLNEGEGGSSGSVQTDDDNLKDFIKLLEQKKELPSFNRTDMASRVASMRRTTAALSKYQSMKDSNAQLSESLSSSMLLHRSSSSSSRQLSSVPPMIAGTSVSTSSSPGKPISPHTPHTPAIPSRLSANSVIDYTEHEAYRSRSRARNAARRDEVSSRGEDSSDTTTREPGTNAIDIPSSPRAWPYRRSSSVAQRNRMLDDDSDLYGIRSSSLPAEDRQELSLSELLTAADTNAPAEIMPGRGLAGAPSAGLANRQSARRESGEESSPQGGVGSGGGGGDGSSDMPLPYHTRPPRAGGGRPGSSFGTRGSGASARASRPSFSSRAVEDEEPLLFTMSDFGAQSRRSVEEGRGGSSAGAGAGAGAGGGRKRGGW